MKIEDADTIFAYSLIPEEDIEKLFKIIDLDNSHIKNVCDFVDTRNDMAHATGRFEILTEEAFSIKASSVHASITAVHNCMEKQIRKWYSEVLLNFCAGEYDAYDEPKEFISEQIIQNFKLSVAELLVCNEMSVSTLITQHRGYHQKLKAFKKAVTSHCEDRGYV